MDQAFWDERYRSADRVWSGKPNPQLVAEVEKLSPGTALEVGAGEGADSVWLAEQGWRVTGVDISPVALERAAAHAAERGAEIAGRISWEHHDVTEWTPPKASFDLVTVHFLHFPSAERREIYRRLADAVAEGGVLLVVGHHPSDLETGVRRPSDPDRLFTADDIEADLEGEWTIVANDARSRSATDTNGAPATVHDAVLVARRGPPA